MSHIQLLLHIITVGGGIMDQSTNICQQLGKILSGKAHSDNNVCTVEHDRKNINVLLMGKPFHSISHDFHFEINGENTPGLITCELVLLENEVPYVTTYLTNQGITVSAIHNHWLMDNPKLIYIHCQTVMISLDFAHIMADLFQYIG
jgi:hypothetical protein